MNKRIGVLHHIVKYILQLKLLRINTILCDFNISEKINYITFYSCYYLIVYFLMVTFTSSTLIYELEIFISL